MLTPFDRAYFGVTHIQNHLDVTGQLHYFEQMWERPEVEEEYLDEAAKSTLSWNDGLESNRQVSRIQRDNQFGPGWILHASISCMWTIGSNRERNIHTDTLSLIQNRKGRFPRVMVVTAEPYPDRISALALGTGDLDCVYHFALPELVAAVEASGNADSREMLRMMIDGKRLRDISDLPFDLAV